MTSAGQTADSARLAMTGEAPVIAEIQRRSWPDRLPPEAVERLGAEVGLDELAAVWERAIGRPPEARFRVLVAVGGDGRLTGFAVTGPSDDPDADPARTGAVEEFVIDPAARGRGHGSRLLNAVADTLRADGFTRATWWLPTGDDTTRAFLAAAGWEADGAHREIGTEDGDLRVRQVRLHTGLAD